MKRGEIPMFAWWEPRVGSATAAQKEIKAVITPDDFAGSWYGLQPVPGVSTFQSQRARRRTVGSIFCNVLQLDPCQAVPAPDFSPGKRAFKPARTLYLATTGFSPGETNTTTLTFGRMPQSGLERETGAVCMVIGVSVDGIGCPPPGLKALNLHPGAFTRV